MPDTTVRLHGEHPSALPAGTRLGEYEVLSLLGVGGFGIVYLAFDHALEREVAIKEYMPASLAGRTETLHVSVRSQSDVDTFALGLRSFVNEARLLARFDHPSLLKVHRFWEANGTAYMAMPVMRGRTLKELRAEMAQPPDEAWLRTLLTPLLGAIEKLHSEGVFHRDIAPDNILVEPDGLPVLLDFGAARRVISGKTQTLTAILKPAYAPIEQYADDERVKQGPWTDLYALGATLHYLLLHRPPPPATTRAVHDEASALSPSHCPGCSAGFLKAIDWMLAPRPADRPQSVTALREVLDGQVTRPVDRAPTPDADAWERTVVLQGGAAGESGTAAGPMALDPPPDDDATRVIAPPAAASQTRPSPAATAPADTPAPAGAPIAVPAPARVASPAAARAATDKASDDLSAPPVSAMQAPAPRKVWWPWATAAALAAVLAGGYGFWPRTAAPTGPDPAAAPASAPGQLAAPQPAASLPSVPPVAESAITTVVVPPARQGPAREAPLATVGEGSPPRGAGPAARDTPAAAKAPAARSQTPARSPSPTSGELAPSTTTPTPALAAPPSPAAASAGPPPTAPAPAEAAVVKPAAAAGPEAVCAGRNPILYFVCMERECLRSTNMEHADCLKWRAEAQREPRN